MDPPIKLFVKYDHTSYTHTELWMWYRTIRSQCECDPGYARTPRGNGLGWHASNITPSQCETETLPHGHSWEDLMVTWSHGTRDWSGDECPLTLDKYSNPYYLVQASRCYELSAIIEAISHTYLVGVPLRLESCVL